MDYRRYCFNCRNWQFLQRKKTKNGNTKDMGLCLVYDEDKAGDKFCRLWKEDPDARRRAES